MASEQSVSGVSQHPHAEHYQDGEKCPRCGKPYPEGCANYVTMGGGCTRCGYPVESELDHLT